MGSLPFANNPETSRSLIERDRDVILEALKTLTDDPEASFPFQAQLPEIVGIVPEKEQAFFDNPLASYKFHGFRWSDIPDELAGTAEQISQDLEAVDRKVGNFTIARADFTLGDQNQGLHIDTGVVLAKQAGDIFYLIANRNPILSHQGPGNLQLIPHHHTPSLKTIALAPDFTSTVVASAPDYGIIRCTRATVHQSDPPTHGLEVKDRVLLRPIFLY